MIPSFTSGNPNFAFSGGDADGAGERCFATSAQSKSVDSGDDRLAEIFNEIHHILPAPRFRLGLNRRIGGYLIDIRAGDEGFVAGAGQDNAVDFFVVPCALEGGPQVRNGRFVECVEHLRTVERDVRDPALLFVKNRFERQSREWPMNS